MTVRVRLPDGETREVSSGVPAGDILRDLRLEDEPLAARVNGKVVDLSAAILTDCELEPVMPGTPEGLDVLRHSSAHVMAQAVSRLFPHVEFAIGPVIEDGFYYDFDLPHVFTPDDLPKIAKEMEKIIGEDLPVERVEMSKDEALALLKKQFAKFKQELVSEMPGDEPVSFYRQGEFTDLCRGPHVPRTGALRSFHLLSIAGAYWRGDERREMLQRIYATAFFAPEDLDEFLRMREEAKKRDHRRIGKDLDLFSFQQEAPGMAFWHPRGTILYEEVVGYLKECLAARDYDWIQTPVILNESLWRESGHWDHYKENMFFTEVDEVTYAVKPMNCPGGTRVYRSSMRSYRDLPIRMAELGLVHRNEKSGVLSGLFRVVAFTQDDAHHYCTPEQAPVEVGECIDLLFEVYETFGFKNTQVELSTRPPKSMGTAEMWERGEAALRDALESKGVRYDLNPGEGAFYGPKIDFHVQDAIKRSWQCGTIQIDFSMPERFDLSYVGEDGEKHRPVMIHRAILGSVERFLGILIEHYGGAFPTWLAPEQVRVIPVSEEKQKEYASRVVSTLKAAGIRASVDRRPLKVGKQIREAEVSKVPYMLVLGPREEEKGTVAVRRRDSGDMGPMSLEEFRDQMIQEIASRSQEFRVGG